MGLVSGARLQKTLIGIERCRIGWDGDNQSFEFNYDI